MYKLRVGSSPHTPTKSHSCSIFTAASGIDVAALASSPECKGISGVLVAHSTPVGGRQRLRRHSSGLITRRFGMISPLCMKKAGCGYVNRTGSQLSIIDHPYATEQALFPRGVCNRRRAIALGIAYAINISLANVKLLKDASNQPAAGSSTSIGDIDSLFGEGQGE